MKVNRKRETESKDDYQLSGLNRLVNRGVIK